MEQGDRVICAPPMAEVGAARFEPAFRDDPYQAVVMFHMETHPTDQPAVAAELLPVSLQQLVTDRLLGLCHLETILNPPNLIAITGWSADPSESLIGLAEELCAQVLRALGTTVTVGVGRACRNFMELPGSRRDSLAAVEYKAIAGEGRAYYYGDLQSVEWEPFDWDRRREERFLFAIKYGTQEQIDAALEELMSRLDGLQPGDWSYAAGLAGIAGFVFRTAQRYETETPRDGILWSRLLDRNCPLEKAKEMLLNLSLQIRASLAQRRNSGAKNLAEAAKQYIQANYQNPDLSVETICSELHISQSYFSNLFKQETGKSCIQYLTSVRMDRAVELLRTTDDRTYLVAPAGGRCLRRLGPWGGGGPVRRCLGPVWPYSLGYGGGPAPVSEMIPYHLHISNSPGIEIYSVRGQAEAFPQRGKQGPGRNSVVRLVEEEYHGKTADLGAFTGVASPPVGVYVPGGEPDGRRSGLSVGAGGSGRLLLPGGDNGRLRRRGLYFHRCLYHG